MTRFGRNYQNCMLLFLLAFDMIPKQIKRIGVLFHPKHLAFLVFYEGIKIPEMNEKLTALCWDTDVDPDQLSRLLRGDIEKVGHIDRANLFRRLLTTYDWYTLLALIPPDRLREALSEAVLDDLHPASLKERYRYARHVLYG